jgi:hypothetical protein
MTVENPSQITVDFRQNINNLVHFVKTEKAFSLMFFLVFIISLRNLFISLNGDEVTYNLIAENILKGKYYQKDYPTSVIPIIPFMIAFFKIEAFPLIGFIIHKLVHILFTVLALRYIYLLLNDLNIAKGVIYSIILLSITASGFISSLPSLYPEAIVFLTFWGFVYYFNQSKNLNNYKTMFVFLILLVLTRHVFAVLGAMVLFYYVDLIKTSNKKIFLYIILSLILSLPLLFWLKYVYYVESNNLSEISYFNRFKSGENVLWYNIKCGLGLEQHYEVKKINGIPAFISLFVPVTGIRNYTISLVLLFLMYFGYYKNLKSHITRNLLATFSLVFIGLVFAGTGFSRYWLVFLPIIYLGYYFVFEKLNFSAKYFVLFAKIFSAVLILNEFRVTYLLLK